jgi:hypothetical protein
MRKLQQKKAARDRAASIKKVTITCAKGEVIRKATAVSPNYPAGYKKK